MGQAQCARELRRANLHTNGRHFPGPVGSGIRADVIKRIAALHRIGEPNEVSGAVVFLCSDAASLITCQMLLEQTGHDGPSLSTFRQLTYRELHCGKEDSEGVKPFR